MSFRILYVGSNSGTSKHRVDALIRLGHQVNLIDPNSFLPKNWFVSRWQHETGGIFLENIVRNKILNYLNSENKFYDLVFVNQGELISPELIKIFSQFSGKIINYVNDNPFAKRDKNRWKYYLKSVPVYDLLVVIRECNVPEAYALGAKKVVRVFMSADEVAHVPRILSNEDIKKWSSEVLFIGTWMPERGPLIAKLIEGGVPLSIYGNRWSKAEEWQLIKQCWKGNGLYGDDYAKAIQTSKVCLGLLSKGNRDLHTRRSLEIPYLGGLLCAERTDEHLYLYKENEEAVFWDDSRECIEQCFKLLANPELNKSIRENGRLKCIQNKTLNESILKNVLLHV